MGNDELSLKKRIAVAAKRVKADLVVKNGKIVNVFTGEIMEGDIAIVDGVIAGIGHYEGVETLDVEGRMIVPGFIDGHVHLESTMLSPTEFAKVLLQHGVTAVITDPHEIANVAGTTGIDYMLKGSGRLPLDIFVMLPSCVPSTSFESSGAILEESHLTPYYRHPQVLGLAEVMDYPSVLHTEPSMMKKLAAAQHKHIDGHASGVDREGLNIYPAAGIRTDHECITAEEAKDRLDLGMYLMIREGTACKNLDALLPAVTMRNSKRCLFVTDDKLLDDLIDEGSVDHIVRLAIKRGLDPITAIQMVTVNAAECFSLRNRGALAPGYIADFVVVDDLEQLPIHAVYKAGECVVRQGKLERQLFPEPVSGSSGRSSLPKMNAKAVLLQDFQIPLSAELCNIIEIIPGQIVTHHRTETVELSGGFFQPSVSKDQMKLAVIERHHATGNIGLGIVKGFRLKKGAIATTVAHDSHNIVIVGASDEDMLAAYKQIIKNEGGLAVVSDQEVIASLPLPIAGLMSDQPYEAVYGSLNELNQALHTIGFDEDFDPFLTLSFLTLPVVPNLKLTDKGLFEFHSFRHIPVQVE